VCLVSSPWRLKRKDRRKRQVLQDDEDGIVDYHEITLIGDYLGKRET